MNPGNMRLILASASPRRTQLLSQAMLDNEVIVSGADEDVQADDPARLVEMLSNRKAGEVYSRILNGDIESLRDMEGDFAVIGADTVVALDDVILGKPHDEKDAERMLKLISGRSHHVFTGVTLCARIGTKRCERSFSEESMVHVAELSPEEIRDYIATREPLDKAGSYGIQGAFMKFITRIEGDYFNIVGLPVSRVYRELKMLQKRGATPWDRGSAFVGGQLPASPFGNTDSSL